MGILFGHHKCKSKDGVLCGRAVVGTQPLAVPWALQIDCAHESRSHRDAGRDWRVNFLLLMSWTEGMSWIRSVKNKRLFGTSLCEGMWKWWMAARSCVLDLQRTIWMVTRCTTNAFCILLFPVDVCAGKWQELPHAADTEYWINFQWCSSVRAVSVTNGIARIFLESRCGGGQGGRTNQQSHLFGCRSK